MSGLWVPHAGFEKAHTPLNASDLPSVVTITAAGSANTKGSYTEVIASTDYDFEVGLLVLMASGVSQSSTDTSALLDIAIGGAGSEVVLVENINIGAAEWPTHALMFPLYVPAGTRIACRSQSVIASDTVDVSIWLYGGTGMSAHPNVYHACETVGANTGTSKGVDLTDATWVELSSATSFPFRAATPSFGMGTFGGDENSVAFGIGASSSEEQIGGSVTVNTGATEQLNELMPGSFLFDVYVASGTRVAMKRDGGRDLTGIAHLFR